jgi:hypothetical protein
VLRSTFGFFCPHLPTEPLLRPNPTLIESMCACSFPRFCMEGNLPEVLAVTWAFPDVQRAFIDIALACCASEPSDRLSVEGARDRLVALAEFMPGFVREPVRGRRPC